MCMCVIHMTRFKTSSPSTGQNPEKVILSNVLYSNVHDNVLNIA